MKQMKTAILDLDSVAFSIGNPNKVFEDGKPIMTTSKAGNLVFVYVDKTIDELKSSADTVMETILKNCDADAYIGYIKGNSTTTFRKSINPEYKANRTQEQPIWWEPVKQYLIEKWGAVEVHNMEVDDAVNITRLNLPDSFIVAIDGDLLGLVGTHFQWRSKDSLVGKRVTVTKYEADIKFWSDMICGQTVDNIKGIPSKGAKYFDKMIEKYYATGESLLALVIREYINYFGEYRGIQEFYKNYIALKTLEEYPAFTVPEPIIVQKKQKIDLFS